MRTACTYTPAPPAHLLVNFRAVVEALLTGAGHSPADAGRVPGTNASHLAQTAVGLAGQAGHTPALHHALDSVTAGDGDGVNHLVGLQAHKGGMHAHQYLHQAQLTWLALCPPSTRTAPYVQRASVNTAQAPAEAYLNVFSLVGAQDAFLCNIHHRQCAWLGPYCSMVWSDEVDGST